MLKILLIYMVLITHLVAEDIKTGQFLGNKNIEHMPAWFKTSFLDFADDIAESSESSKHLILYFHQNGCPYCAKLIEENFTNTELVIKIRKDFDIIAINMWGDKNLTDLYGNDFTEKKYAELLKVQFTPSLFFLNTKGDIALRMDGYQSIANMHKILDFISGKHYQQQSFAKFSNIKNNNGELNFQKFFNKPLHILSRNDKYQAEKFLAVFFETGHCIECDNFHKNMLTKNNIISAFEQMEVVQLNTNKDEKIIDINGNKTTSKNWYKQLKLTTKPAIVFFAKNGKEIIRKDGFFKEFHFDSILQYVLTNAYKTQPNFQKYIEHRADKIRATGKDVNIWQD